jgi:transposase
MSVVPLLGWLVAGGLLLVVAWLRVDSAEARQAAERQRIERETVSDWADEYQREAAALDAECVRLRNQVATLQMLYAERTRELLAENFRIIATNVALKRRRQQ